MSARTGTATVLFIDLVGSTALRATLGEEGADELRRAHDALLGRCVSAHGGGAIKGGGDGISGRSGPRRPSPTSAGVHRGASRLTVCPHDSTDDLAEATLPAHPDLLIPPADLSRG